MPGLSESFFANKSFALLVAALAFLAAVILLSVIFRFAFGRRLRLPRNGRARQPRLGTVDAFDLDRQRQLVIIRRDNVEHLMMIGGPNDLVIELQIIRAESREPRDFRDARIREKEVRDKEPRDAVSWPSTAESPSPYPPQRKMPFPPAAVLEPETGVTDAVHNEGSIPEFTPSTVLPAQRPPVFPVPPRRASPAATPFSQRLPNQREVSPGARGSLAKTRGCGQSCQGFSTRIGRDPFFAVLDAATSGGSNGRQTSAFKRSRDAPNSPKRSKFAPRF